MNLERFENERWEGMQQRIEFRHKAARELIDGGEVLDLGCGDGLLLQMLREKGVAGEGVDISKTAVEKCRAKGLKAQVHSFDRPLPYRDNTFRSVVLLDVLEHGYTPLELLREARRVSSKFVIVGVPNFSSLPARLQMLRGYVPENNQPHKGHVYWFNNTVLQDLAADAHLHEVAKMMNTFSPFSYLGDIGPRLFPNLLALSYVAKFSKHGP
jgi:methionine biosynthesis protein MetW